MKSDLNATLLLPDGTSHPCEPTQGRHWTLAELQKHVGGFIELVAVPSQPGMVLVVDDEGNLKGLALNLTATGLAGKPIVGPAVLTPRAWVR